MPAGLKKRLQFKVCWYAEITIEFQLRSLLSDEEAQIPTQNVKYPREIGFEDSDLYTDDPEEAYCEGNTSQNVSEEQLVVTSEDDDHPDKGKINIYLNY